ncbi:MAG: UDP-N-acetylmuramate--L-alanyl-gamma-D-glutamyl-meso-2,6-diaminoheptandioate ligase [Opitutia bacterium UBA7350]|nr:MAG: UDP-N-acetylmuramate--L-alanyl-gamma-D-glutamyl-meso-2,6-diaminoheptandioate ligase [Opitutae bacterium UBA7350]
MGNTALLLKAQGHQVSGSDLGAYPPMSDMLVGAGIEIFEGFSKQRLSELKPDLVVIGNVMSRGNEEVEWVLENREVSYRSLPQLLRDQILGQRLPIVITGTHGKTTTATMTAFLLDRAGAEPGWLIGGLPRDLKSGAHLGSGTAFVIEGDEYDSAFFDKRSKFIHYCPQIAVLNNLEFDHADIFRDLQDVQRSFQHFLRLMPRSGTVLLNGDDPNLEALMPTDWTRVIRVGTDTKHDLQLVNFIDGPKGSSFELHWQGALWAQVDWELHGLFNARNGAMAAIAAALAQGYKDPKAMDLSCLTQFRGVQRRQDVLYEADTLKILEDFAHHPTAVSGTIEALRAAHPKSHLTVCFEPRSNTATRAVFREAFTEALGLADTVYLGAVHRVEHIPKEDRLDTVQMAEDLCVRGLTAAAFESNEALLKTLKETLDASGRSHSVVVFFTNGSFEGIQHSLAGAL